MRRDAKGGARLPQVPDLGRAVPRAAQEHVLVCRVPVDREHYLSLIIWIQSEVGQLQVPVLAMQSSEQLRKTISCAGFLSMERRICRFDS